MKRFLLFVFVLLSGCAKKPPLPDAQRIQGEWVVVDFQSPKKDEDRGQRRKRAIISEATWSEQFQGDTFEDFEYKLDPSKSPKEVDLIFTNASGQKLTIRGIYELTEPDHIGDALRVCFDAAVVVEKNKKEEFVESVRPKTFESKTGTLIRFRRKTE